MDGKNLVFYLLNAGACSIQSNQDLWLAQIIFWSNAGYFLRSQSIATAIAFARRSDFVLLEDTQRFWGTLSALGRMECAFEFIFVLNRMSKYWNRYFRFRGTRFVVSVFKQRAFIIRWEPLEQQWRVLFRHHHVVYIRSDVRDSNIVCRKHTICWQCSCSQHGIAPQRWRPLRIAQRTQSEKQIVISRSSTAVASKHSVSQASIQQFIAGCTCINNGDGLTVPVVIWKIRHSKDQPKCSKCCVFASSFFDRLRVRDFFFTKNLITKNQIESSPNYLLAIWSRT